MIEKASTLLLFGATGDLARRMLLPSLYGLDADGLLPDDLRIVGTARTELDDDGVPRARRRGAAGASARRLLSGGDRRAVPRAAPLCPARHQRPGGLRAARRDDRRSVPRRRDLPVDRAVAVQADHRRARRRRASPARRCAWRSKSRSAPTSNRAARSTTRSPPPSPRSAPSGSTIISARKRSRTCSRCASPIRCSSRCGTARTSTMSRSPSPRPIGLEGRGDYYDERGRAARHGPEPHAAAARAGGDGAADRFRRDRGARREGQGAARAAPDRGRRRRGD